MRIIYHTFYQCSISVIFALFIFVTTVYASSITQPQPIALSVKERKISLVANNVSSREILRQIGEQTGIKIQVLEGVADKKVSVDVADIPYLGISTLLDKMGIANYGIAHDQQSGNLYVYVVNAGTNISEIAKGKTLVQRVGFGDQKKISKVKGKEIVTTADDKKGYSISYVKDEALLKFHLGTTEQEITETLLKHNLVTIKDNSLAKLGYVKVTIPDGRSVPDVVKELAKERIVKKQEPNYIQKILAISDPLYPEQWYATSSRFEQASPTLKSAATVTVAVIDTGVQGNHPDLMGRILKGYDFVNSKTDAADDNGHGTFVSGIIAANANNIGITGMYANARILPVKVMDASGVGTYEDAAKGIIYAADNGAKIINLSIGGYAASPMLLDAVGYAQSKGCIVVAAGGNDGIEKEVYPAAYPDVIGVAALEGSDSIWPSSNSGRHIAVAAPGANIISTTVNGGYSVSSGSSAAAPMVAALAAMLVAERADLSSSVLARLIQQTARDLGEKGKDKVFGAGAIDAVAALGQQVRAFHDVAVQRLYLDTKIVDEGKDAYVNLIIANKGSYPKESVTVKVLLNDAVILEQQNLPLASSASLSLPIQMDTKQVAKYTITATISAARDDFPGNNSKIITNKFVFDETQKIHVLLKDLPPVHSWVAWQAFQMLPQSMQNGMWPYFWGGDAESLQSQLFGANKKWIDDYKLPTTPTVVADWQTNADWNGLLGADYGSSLIEGTWAEDQPGARGGWHFWEPDNSFVDGLWNYSSAPMAASLWYTQALKAYKDGYFSHAYYLLGRVTHLLSDMGVPDHVHVDPHLDGMKDGIVTPNDFCNYEEYTKLIYRDFTFSQATPVVVNSLPLTPPSDSDWFLTYRSYNDISGNYDYNLTKLFYNLAQFTQHFDSSGYGPGTSVNPNGNNNEYSTSTSNKLKSMAPPLTLSDGSDLLPQNGSAIHTYKAIAYPVNCGLKGIDDNNSQCGMDPGTPVSIRLIYYPSWSSTFEQNPLTIDLVEGVDFGLARGAGYIGLTTATCEKYRGLCSDFELVQYPYYKMELTYTYRNQQFTTSGFNLETATGPYTTVPDIEVRKQANILMPKTISYVAALYNLFWNETHNLTVTASPASTNSEVTGPIQVTLTANQSATIYYTLDGSDPTTSSSRYRFDDTGTITLSKPGIATVRFMAVNQFGKNFSGTTQYRIRLDPTTNTTSPYFQIIVPDRTKAAFNADNSFYAEVGDNITVRVMNASPSPIASLAGQQVRVFLYLPNGDSAVVAGTLNGESVSFMIGGTTIDSKAMTAGRYRLITLMGIDAQGEKHTIPIYDTVFLTEMAPGTVDSGAGAATTSGIAQWGKGMLGFDTLTNVSAIAAGAGNLVVKRDGTAFGWGFNYNTPKDLSNVKSVAVGKSHSLALKNDGTVVAWCDNAYDRKCTVPAGVSGVTAVAAGDNHSLALRSDGTVVAWGAIYGNGVPEGLSDVIAIAAGDSHSLALKSDGTVVAWGSNLYGQVSVPAGLGGVTAISAGDDYSMALKNDGTVVAWGWHSEYNHEEDLSGITAIAAGNHARLAIKNDGTVMQWGESLYMHAVPGLTGVTAIASGDQLMALRNDGTVFVWSEFYDLPVFPLNVSDVTAIAASYFHVLALKHDGTVVAWGDNSNQQCNIPAGLNGVQAVAAANKYSVALKLDGTVVAWGDDHYFYGDLTFNPIFVPVGLSRVTAIAAGGDHILALKDDGTVVAWGRNYNGQSSVPAGLSGATAIAAGYAHSLALKNDGTVVAWGDNSKQQCNIPAGLSGVTAISANGYGNLALKNDGTVVAWGDNYYGQNNIPEDLSGVTAIAAANDHNLALKSDGKVVAWGANGFGQSSVPVGLGGVTAIAGSYGYNLVLASTIPDKLVFPDLTKPSVTFLSENLPDGTYQVGPATKTWRFKTGERRISGLHAVMVDRDNGLGIAQQDVLIGDVAADTEFQINLPIDPIHGYGNQLRSTWKLVDGTGRNVIITNIQTGQFWLKISINRAPQFSPVQLESIAGKENQEVCIPIAASDEDSDWLVYKASSGDGYVHSSSTGNGPLLTEYCRSYPVGVHAVTITANDAYGGTASFTFQAVITSDSRLIDFYSDVKYTDATNQALKDQYHAIHYLTLNGITIGYPIDPNDLSNLSRMFNPNGTATQAEALAVIMKSAAKRGMVAFDVQSRLLPNLIKEDVVNEIFYNYSWLTPMLLKAEDLGIIPTADTFEPTKVATREWLAYVVTRLMNLETPMDVTDPATYLFADETSFSSPDTYNAARTAAFFGYMAGSLGSAVEFRPADSISRADMAVVAAKILRSPTIDGIATNGLTMKMLFGKSLPTISHGSSFTVTGVNNLIARRYWDDGAGNIMDDWLFKPDTYTKAYIVRPGFGYSGPATVESLAVTPISVPTDQPDISVSEVRKLLVLLESTDFDGRNPVRGIYRMPYGVMFPDRDGDGVRDELDLWPDNTFYAHDTNGNGIPDNADALWGVSGRNASDFVNINGQSMTLINAVLNGALYGDKTAPTTMATVTNNQSITLATSETATIRYTSDGSTPTMVSPLYSGSVTFPQSASSLQFFATDLAGNSESIKTFNIAGVCGSANGSVFKTAPSSDLCSVGASSTVTGTGPWSWSCTFMGITANCTTVNAPNSKKAGDCNSDSNVTLDEVQLAINMFLGIRNVESCVDEDISGIVSISEVQKVLNGYLGL